jgi:two-component system sensor histidine kinase/response regulator
MPPLTSNDFAGRRVCLVDDNPTNRSLLQYHVSAWNMHHESAVDAPSALALLRQAAADGTPFDLAIIDMHMPDIGGLQLCRLIKEDPADSRDTPDRPDGVRPTRRQHRGEGSRCERVPSQTGS